MGSLYVYLFSIVFVISCNIVTMAVLTGMLLLRRREDRHDHDMIYDMFVLTFVRIRKRSVYDMLLLFGTHLI